MRLVIGVVLVAATALLHPVKFAVAESVLSSAEIVEGFQEKQPQLTRSLTQPSSSKARLSPEERAFLGTVSSRGLKIERIEEAGKIIDQAKLPSLDIEIRFELNSSEINPASGEQLAALGEALRDPAFAGSKILLNGHTDATGDENYNLELSQTRANTVRARLISDFGVPASRLVAIGFGEKRLKSPGEPGSAVNRRVEVINIGPEQ